MDNPIQTDTDQKVKEELSQKHYLANLEDFNIYFKSYYQAAKAKGERIVIKHYYFLSKNVEVLELLSKGEVAFTIEDYQELNIKGIKFILKHIQLEREAFGKQISEKLRRRSEAGLHVGNPEITKKAKESASRQRVRLALFDPINIKMAQMIASHRSIKNNFNAIATEFNSQGMKSRRGGNFYAKSVERIFKRYEAIEGNFTTNPHFSKRSTKAAAKGLKLLEWKDTYEFDEQIQFICTMPKQINFTIQINIYNWKNKKPIYSTKHEDAAKNRFLLPIEKALFLFPGQHYLELIGPNQARIVRPFIVASSIQEIFKALTPAKTLKPKPAKVKAMRAPALSRPTTLKTPSSNKRNRSY